MRKPPVILKVFPSLPRVEQYPMQEFKVRAVQYGNSVKLVDIREYITSVKFTGYSPKGLSFTKEQFEYLIKYGPEILESLKDDNTG